jgi:hypothetical protein
MVLIQSIQVLAMLVQNQGSPCDSNDFFDIENSMGFGWMMSDGFDNSCGGRNKIVHRFLTCYSQLHSHRFTRHHCLAQPTASKPP